MAGADGWGGMASSAVARAQLARAARFAVQGIVRVPLLLAVVGLVWIAVPDGNATAECPAEAPTVERGRYLVNNVANCAGCHSPRNMLDGSYAGPRLSGGTPAPLDGDETLLVTPPNLTPDPKTGHITNWTEEQFVARFRQGKIVEGSHMPWGPFGRMSDDDLRAIYRYLKSLDPVEHDTGPILRKKTDE